ncbi:MAG: glycosyltransferase [Jatrophihabitans sp.]|uniref:glycosyltransferase n=1 Tax=Jatrophihabitans sp. TaxID=1932789 RepID=UPI003F823944
MIREVVTVIPAHDEEDRLGAALAAVTRSERLLRWQSADAVRCRVVVALDACADGSGAVAAGFPTVETVALDARCVGAARAAGAALALAGRNPREVWLANTDADSEVPVTWLPRMLADAQRGVQLRLGTVLPADDLAHASAHRWHRQHVLREHHPHVHGANLGIRGDVYLALGGWPALRTGEDWALADRARRAGHLWIARTALDPVRTSARLDGRAPEGFSSYLRGLAADSA